MLYIVRAVYKAECLVGSQTLIFSRGGLQIRRNESAGTSPLKRGRRNEWIPIMRTNILIVRAVYKSECLVGSQTLIFSRGGLQIRRNKAAETRPPKRVRRNESAGTGAPKRMDSYYANQYLNWVCGIQIGVFSRVTDPYI